jgi:hypothetical protein
MSAPQRLFFHLVALREIDGAPGVAVQAALKRPEGDNPVILATPVNGRGTHGYSYQKHFI